MVRHKRATVVGTEASDYIQLCHDRLIRCNHRVYRRIHLPECVPHPFIGLWVGKKLLCYGAS